MNQEYVTDILPVERQISSGRTVNSVWDYGMAIERPRKEHSLFARIFWWWWATK